MLIDAHVHTSGISCCSRRNPLQMIAQFLADKYMKYIRERMNYYEFSAEIRAIAM